MKKTVLIYDHQHVVVLGITFILQKLRKDIIIDHVLDKEELMDKVNKYDYDLLILDIEWLDTFFETVIKNLKVLNPGLKIMVFTDCKKENAFRYICKGVVCVMSKSHDESELLTAFKNLFLQGYYYPQEVLHEFVHPTKARQSLSRSRLDILSARERSVYFYLVKGSGLLEIANELGLHQSTVSIYKMRLFKKLEVKSLAELIHQYHKNEI
ncbi:DNA-binding response regulator [Chryseobacterium nematophagum]|uniref:DNA-binding response regulator n=1 Tax=Chryseobacterium nematophagum TaxID=2305228 RepID=A0A3M7TCT6_9FLAO|nr:response regulator transcription factor [Chryseobacterium nematophagum]RNA60439.1 DNA-binding response regulator [Chryseobacterium nematophagum]RNA60523.1 DNA-binding response regulator [Chryseobacterium nematophagum]